MQWEEVLNSLRGDQGDFLSILSAMDRPEPRERLVDMYRQHYRCLCYKAAEFGAGEDAEDLVREAFLRVARREDLWTSLTDRQLLAYLARTVHNLTVSKLRKTGRELLAEDLDETVAGDDALERLLDRLTREEQRRQCAAALQALSPRDRTILIQKYLFQYSDERIAEGLGIRRASVPMALSRARDRLREVLAASERGGLRRV